MNPFALACLVTVAVFVGGLCSAYLAALLGDLPRCVRFVLTLACAYAAGFASCAIALVIRTQ